MTCKFESKGILRGLRRQQRFALLTVCLAWAFSPAAFAANSSCNFTTATAVRFGSYSVFSLQPNSNGVGTIIVDCGGGGGPFLVTLSSGQSYTYKGRAMLSRGNSLNYNPYTTAARVVIWGDGSGGSRTMAAAKNSNTTLSIFGQIPAGQDVSVGTYTDAIVATVTF